MTDEDDRFVVKGDPRYLGLLDEMRALHIRKSADYGADDDPLANLRGSAPFGISPWIGALIRGQDKMFRLQAAAKGSTLVNEGVEDSLMDLAAYALLSLILYKEEYHDY